MKALIKVMPAIVLVSVFLLSCGTRPLSSGTDSRSQPDTLRFEALSSSENDSIEYELLILDHGFDAWYMVTSLSPGFYVQSYLENWNMRLSIQWNNAISTRGNGRCRPETYLAYDPRIDYGLELNHKLFYYFRYVQESCRIFSTYPPAWGR
jgi:hypothetical protein